MAKNKIENLDALIFIDTNIFLDFYRVRKSNVSMKWLEEIEKHKDLIITSSQVEMEFKKNRQSVILDSINEVKKIKNNGLNIPAIISNAQAAEMIKKSQKYIDEQQKKLKQQIERILKNPKTTDPVYKSLQKLFKNESPFNLDRENKIRFKIRNLAKKRFLLGYPPRKATDNSIGDAVNWEWIINCAENSGKHIILVTRDTDFGASYDNELYLNDWLQQEFKQRVSRNRKIILTDRLMTAFKLVKITVTAEMVEEEEKILTSTYEMNSAKIQEALREISEKIDFDNWNNNMSKTYKLLNQLKNK